jgi:hypothetical protein
MLRTYAWMPCQRIVFSTFPRCMSFHTAWNPTQTLARSRTTSIQNDSGLPQGPADLSPGRLYGRQTACAPSGGGDAGAHEKARELRDRPRCFLAYLGGLARNLVQGELNSRSAAVSCRG